MLSTLKALEYCNVARLASDRPLVIDEFNTMASYLKSEEGIEVAFEKDEKKPQLIMELFLKDESISMESKWNPEAIEKQFELPKWKLF